MNYTLNSAINVTASSFLAVRSVILFEMLATSVIEMRATSFLALRALFALMVGRSSGNKIRKILTSMLQKWHEYDSREG